ncbi:MAG TPA: antibiotic biosynthesis monooxygenase [Microbacteriaceae bacterium]|jgi:quinol monooxygenase YgiN|nr:antibiotic biosynthesis monooxygenase [Microbacteriaceae bacterium]
MKSLYAEFTALDGAADRVEELLLALANAVRQEPGNLVFDAYRKTDDPLAFFVYEIYADEDAFRAHLDQEHGRVFNEQLAGLVRGGRSQLTWLRPLAELDDGGQPGFAARR